MEPFYGTFLIEFFLWNLFIEHFYKGSMKILIPKMTKKIYICWLILVNTIRAFL